MGLALKMAAVNLAFAKSDYVSRNVFLMITLNLEF
jgi:hypothetical protein